MQITECSPINQVAWQPPDNITVDPESIVQVKQTIRAGECLFVDKNAPLVRHVAPVSGQVAEIVRDEINQLTHIVIDKSNAPPKQFTVNRTSYTRQRIRELLMESGLWTHIRQRPFDTVPPIDAAPLSIMITAIDTRPSSADPRPIIQSRQSEFDAGIEALSTQAEGSVWICQPPGTELTSTSFENVESVAFSGHHPAGMASLHMQKLLNSQGTQSVWHIDYQDVIAIGFLLVHGELSTEKIVSLCGDLVRQPRLVSTHGGANISDLIQNELINSTGDITPIVGSFLSGRTKQWLGRFDHQVTVMRTKYFKPFNLTAVAPRITGFVADPVFDRVNTLNILPVPLLRALVADDIEMAEKLGCTDLCPDDLDIFNYVCPEGNNYSDLLARCNKLLSSRYSSSIGKPQHAV